MTLTDFLPLLRQSFTDPRGAIRVLTTPTLPRQTLWLALAAVGALASLTLGLLSLGSDAPPGMVLLPGQDAPQIVSPLTLLALQIGSMLLVSGLVYAVGRLFGGQGSFDAALTVLIWLQIMMLAAQFAIFAVGLVVLPLAGLLALAVIAASVWWFCAMVAEIHGAGHPLKVLMASVATVIALAFALSVLLALLGVPVPTPPEAP